MGVTDQTILSEIQLAVVEMQVGDGGATWPSGLWTKTEVLGYLNQRQYRFLKDTGIFVSQDRIPVSAHTLRVSLVDQLSLPLVSIQVVEASWKYTTGVDQTTIWPMERISDLEIDLAQKSWTTSYGRPKTYMEVETPTLTLQLGPPPDLAGLIYLEYIGLTALLDGSGEIFTVPDELVPAIKWGALSDMLGKAGRGQNLSKAQYCESRYQEGVAIAQSLLETSVL